MKWWTKDNNFIMQLPSIRLSLMITDHSFVRLLAERYDIEDDCYNANKASDEVHQNDVCLDEEQWCSPVKDKQTAVPLVISEDGGTILIHGRDITIQMKQDLSITMLQGSKVIFATPANGVLQEQDLLSIRMGLKEEEKIYGLGQDPMGNLDHNGYERRMWNQWGGSQRCGNAGIGYYMSDSGYGLLLNSISDARFRFGKAKPPVLDPLGETMVPSLWSLGRELPKEEAQLEVRDDRMELFILPGKDLPELLIKYYELTGYPKPMPKWAYGLLQCKNRYMNQEDLLRIAKTYREKGIPCDGLIIDWLWFTEFGDLEWKKEDWPDPESMLRQLQKMGFSISSAQHPFISEKGKYFNEYRDKNYLNKVPENKRITYDHTNPEARKYWWNKTKKLYDQGLRGYWLDMGELEEHFDGTISYGGSQTRTHNGYSYVWAQGIYEGQRKDYGTRPFILSRSGSAGIQTYGTAIWSGDIDASWKVLKNQIVIGQGMAMSGIPNWTTDIGGFYTGKEFTPELFIRWVEWGAFCTVFRTHGTRPDNEPWSYGLEEEKLLRQIITLRYQLLPYIYSLALAGAIKGTPVVRPMAYDYGEDKTAVGCTDQFLFGPSILVAPVTESGSRSRMVYLPQGEWYHWWTGQKLSTGWHKVAAPLGRVPLFVRAGSIIPMYSQVGENIARCKGLNLVLFPGTDGSFDYYNDDGETYQYEDGRYTHVHFTYKETTKELRAEVIQGVMPEFHEKIFSGNEARYDYHEDCIWDGGNRVTVNLTFEREFNGLIELQPDPGWRVIACSEDEQDNRNMFEAKAGKCWNGEVHKERCDSIQWNMVYEGCVTPIAEQKVMLHIKKQEDICTSGVTREMKNNREKEFTVIRIIFGTSYLDGLSMAGCFTIPKEIDTMIALDTVFIPEEEMDQPYYLDNGKKISWEKDYEYGRNYFGYQDFRRLNPDRNEEEISGVAYAKGKIYAENAMEAEFILRHDSTIKIWINHQEVHRCYQNNCQDERIRLPLQAGYNQILIKQAARVARPYSGGEFGFSLKYMGEQPLWMTE